MQTDRRANLPANATAAIQRLIQVSQKLVDLSERETQALLQRDMLTFAILQDEKESIANQYTQASEEFRARLEDFRNVEKPLLNRLELLQKNLAEKTQGNNVMVAQIKQRAETGTQKTLLMAQEYGQQKRVRMNDNNARKERGAE
ncbi:MAG TPA: hypothetical protein PKX38_03175 [Alphaproteobacteria bacterium]|jgi:hypothetical protein|nr:hypothetical protein [Micavibrio sp.]MBP7721236.1 hypothetical protein [Alphaproteobacteria bacterium]HQX26920.1 hypothetical protein [Alphaproteobacteria bacterium]